MSVIHISCKDQELEITEATLIASGGVNEDTVIFNFCSLWDGFKKTAVFYQNKKDVYHALLDTNNSCKIPWETIAKKGTLYVGVFGVKGDVTRTSNIVKTKVAEGAITSETAVSDPTPDVYAQLLEAVRVAEEGMNDALKGHTANKNNPHGVTAAQVGARPNTWMPTAADVGARPNTWMPSASDVGARANTWLPTIAEIGAAPASALKQRLYIADGEIITSPGTVRGIGRATVHITPDGVVRVDFTAKITVAGTDSNVYHAGIDPAVLQAINANIPAITTKSAGLCNIYKSSGYIDTTLTGYGAVMIGIQPNNLWSIGRMHNTSFATGSWAENKYTVDMLLTGTCYGVLA